MDNLSQLWGLENQDKDNSVLSTLSVALGNQEPEVFLATLGELAKSYGMSKLSRETGLNRESLYKVFQPDGNPQFFTILKIIHAMGLKFEITNNLSSLQTNLEDNNSEKIINSSLFYKIAELQQKRDINSKIKYLDTESRLIFAERKQISLNLLINLINYAVQHVPYYKSKSEYKFFNTEKLLKDQNYLQDLPILTSEIVQNDPFELISDEYSKSELIIRNQDSQNNLNSTYFDSESRDWISAQNILTLQWAGKRKKWKEARLYSNKSSPSSLFEYLSQAYKDFILNRHNIYTKGDSEEAQDFLLNEIKSSKALILHTKFSIIYNLAKYLHNKSIKGTGLVSTIIITDTVITTEEKQFIQNIFGSQVLIRYGNVHFGVIAQERADGPLGKLMVSDLMVWPEAISLDEQKNKSLVFSNFRNRAMPLIRYKTSETGDLEENNDGWWLSNISSIAS
jgi:phenylacetate-CoA ligase